jgi:hypothetical protein
MLSNGTAGSNVHRFLTNPLLYDNAGAYSGESISSLLFFLFGWCGIEGISIGYPLRKAGLKDRSHHFQCPETLIDSVK